MPNYPAPKFAVATTPRPCGSPPTISGFVRSDGSSSSSTAAKKASRSRCATITPQGYAAGRTGSCRLRAVGLAPLFGRSVVRRRTRRPAHHHAVGLDHVGRRRIPVFVVLDAAARVARSVERVRVTLLLRSGRLLASEQLVEQAHARGGS